MITIDDFAKIELRVGLILEAEDVPGSEKLIKQIVDFGEMGKKHPLGTNSALLHTPHKAQSPLGFTLVGA